jgi:hypothetical protein
MEVGASVRRAESGFNDAASESQSQRERTALQELETEKEA